MTSAQTRQGAPRLRFGKTLGLASRAQWGPASRAQWGPALLIPAGSKGRCLRLPLPVRPRGVLPRKSLHRANQSLELVTTDVHTLTFSSLNTTFPASRFSTVLRKSHLFDNSQLKWFPERGLCASTRGHVAPGDVAPGDVALASAGPRGSWPRHRGKAAGRQGRDSEPGSRS